MCMRCLLVWSSVSRWPDVSTANPFSKKVAIFRIPAFTDFASTPPGKNLCALRAQQQAGQGKAARFRNGNAHKHKWFLSDAPSFRSRGSSPCHRLFLLHDLEATVCAPAAEKPSFAGARCFSREVSNGWLLLRLLDFPGSSNAWCCCQMEEEKSPSC